VAEANCIPVIAFSFRLWSIVNLYFAFCSGRFVFIRPANIRLVVILEEPAWADVY
jgi:hypothetical protein